MLACSLLKKLFIFDFIKKLKFNQISLISTSSADFWIFWGFWNFSEIFISSKEVFEYLST